MEITNKYLNEETTKEAKVRPVSYRKGVLHKSMRKVFQGGICSIALKAVEGIKRDKNVKLILDLVEWWTFVPWTAFR